MRTLHRCISMMFVLVLGCGRPAPGDTAAKVAPKPAPKPAASRPEPPPAAPVKPLRDLPQDLTRAQALKDMEALLTRLQRESAKPFDLARVLVEALPGLREEVENKDLPAKATVRLIPVRGKTFLAALLHVIDPKADACDTGSLNSFLVVAVIRDETTGQSQVGLTGLPEDATILFKGQDLKVGFVEGARDPDLFTVSYEYSNNEDECVDRMVSVDGDYLAIFTIFEGSLALMDLVKESETEHEPGHEVKTSSHVRWFTGGAVDLFAVTVFSQNTYIETGDGMDGRTATCTRTTELHEYGSEGWDTTDLTLPKARPLHPVLKEVPDDTDADTVKACDDLQSKL